MVPGLGVSASLHAPLLERRVSVFRMEDVGTVQNPWSLDLWLNSFPSTHKTPFRQ